MQLCVQTARYDGSREVTNERRGALFALSRVPASIGDHGRYGPRLVTRQLRYRLRHASNAGKAYLSFGLEDSRTSDECRPATG